MMQTLKTATDMGKWRREVGQKDVVGLVPTMGAIHKGHLALVERARAECDLVVASVFVNPLQFGADEDFGEYPRNPERDLELLEQAGVDCVLAPAVKEMYPGERQVGVSAGHLGEVFEGAVRPGHFTGVATIVAKLFALVQPQRAYFGQKDAQQLALVRMLAQELLFPLEIVAVPTVREADGLALSSRNAYLSEEERNSAPVVYRSLEAALATWQRGVRNSSALQRIVTDMVAEEHLLSLDYVAIVHPDTFAEAPLAEEGSLAVVAVRVGKTRLLDAITLA